jgi:hypothetical protein
MPTAENPEFELEHQCKRDVHAREYCVTSGYSERGRYIIGLAVSYQDHEFDNITSD